jgi:adenosylcobinamide-phosphate synthase
MSFFALLFAFLLEQARPLSFGESLERVSQAWSDKVRNTLDTGDQRHAWTAWAAAIGVPCLLVWAIHMALAWYLGWVFAMVWSVAVLYATLGFRHFSHHFTDIRHALSVGDDVLANTLLSQWSGAKGEDLPRQEIIRHVIEYSAIAAHRHVFGVVVWFVVLAGLGLGPVGAIFYRLSEFLSRSWESSEASSLADVEHNSAALETSAAKAWRSADWLPARLTALSFAVVGNFEDAVEAWRHDAAHFPNANDGVVLAATSGAINVRLGGKNLGLPEDELLLNPGAVETTAGREPELFHLRSMVGLVWRAVVMWMLLLALLTLARLLG